MTHKGRDYLDFLSQVYSTVKPRSYFEIGTNTGESLRQFPCDAVCVDPVFQIEENPSKKVLATRRRLFLFQMSSDDFFRDNDLRHLLPGGPDVCFLDGLHWFEALLRDFINAERACHARSIIFLHDCLPLNTRMAERTYRIGPPDEPGGWSGAWTGDVWRLLPILKRYRPDLRVLGLDCPPTGLVAITRVDPASRVLHDNYYAIVDEFSHLDLESYGIDRVWNDVPILDSRALLEPPFLLSALMTAA